MGGRSPKDSVLLRSICICAIYSTTITLERVEAHLSQIDRSLSLNSSEASSFPIPVAIPVLPFSKECNQESGGIILLFKIELRNGDAR
jgi:hypothetical protein